jgi:hypothetical protein
MTNVKNSNRRNGKCKRYAIEGRKEANKRRRIEREAKRQAKLKERRRAITMGERTVSRTKPKRARDERVVRIRQRPSAREFVMDYEAFCLLDPTSMTFKV